MIHVRTFHSGWKRRGLDNFPGGGVGLPLIAALLSTRGQPKRERERGIHWCLSNQNALLLLFLSGLNAVTVTPREATTIRRKPWRKERSLLYYLPMPAPLAADFSRSFVSTRVCKAFSYTFLWTDIFESFASAAKASLHPFPTAFA